MREIKFRVWKPHYSRMDCVELTKYLGGKGIFDHLEGCNDSDVVWLQYTGLKDKNGKEVYEGDVYQHNNNNYVVVWCENFGFILLAANEEYHSFTGILMQNHSYRDFNWIYRTSKHCEVLGNIYENPELLTDK